MWTRKGFIKAVATVVGGFVFAPLGKLFARPSKLAVPLSRTEKLREIGGSMTLILKERKVLFIRDSPTSIRAFDPTCPHMQCDVAYVHANTRIECPCHASLFDLTGKVLGGPARGSLKTYEAKLEDERIIITMDVE